MRPLTTAEKDTIDSKVLRAIGLHATAAPASVTPETQLREWGLSVRAAFYLIADLEMTIEEIVDKSVRNTPSPLEQNAIETKLETIQQYVYMEVQKRIPSTALNGKTAHILQETESEGS